MNAAATEEAICRVCGRAGNHEHYRVREMMFGSGDAFDYFRCARCGCLQISGIPVELSRHYPADYFAFRGRPWLARHRLRAKIDRARVASHLWGDGFTGRGDQAAFYLRRV